MHISYADKDVKIRADLQEPGALINYIQLDNLLNISNIF